MGRCGCALNDQTFTLLPTRITDRLSADGPRRPPVPSLDRRHRFLRRDDGRRTPRLIVGATGGTGHGKTEVRGSGSDRLEPGVLYHLWHQRRCCGPFLPHLRDAARTVGTGNWARRSAPSQVDSSCHGCRCDCDSGYYEGVGLEAHTVEGVSLGDREGAIGDAYGDVEVQPRPYGIETDHWVIAPLVNGNFYVFATTNGIIDQIRVGHEPDVFLIEGCA